MYERIGFTEKIKDCYGDPCAMDDEMRQERCSCFCKLLFTRSQDLLEEYRMKDRQFLLENLSLCTDMAIHVFDCDGNMEFGVRPGSTETDSFIYESLVQRICGNACFESNTVILVTEKDNIIYGCMELLDGAVFILGPCALHKLAKTEITEYRQQHRINESEYDIPVYSYEKIQGCMRIAASLLTGECVEGQILKISYKELDVKKGNTF